LILTRSWTRVSWCAPNSEYSSHLFTVSNKTYYTYYMYYTTHISKIHKTQFYNGCPSSYPRAWGQCQGLCLTSSSPCSKRLRFHKKTWTNPSSIKEAQAGT
jgi:hypothetical protein